MTIVLFKLQIINLVISPNLGTFFMLKSQYIFNSYTFYHNINYCHCTYTTMLPRFLILPDQISHLYWPKLNHQNSTSVGEWLSCDISQSRYFSQILVF